MGWLSYQNRPYVVEELVGVRLGMAPVDVTLTFGLPITEDEPTFNEECEAWRQDWTYDQTQILLAGKEDTDLTVRLVCTERSDVSLFGLGRDYLWLGPSKESDVIDHLGEPDTESVDQTGTRKATFYK